MKRRIQTLVDFAMTVLLLFLMSYSLVGEIAYEWLGIAMLFLFILHHIFNFRWFRSIAKGRYRAVGILSTAIDLLLVIDMFCLTVSSMALSRHVFSFLPIEGGASFARSVHMLGSYW